MANPRQRRKARSSSYRPVSHSKNAKRNLKKMPPIRAPKVLQEAWDKRKTVRQNYAALGLIHDLNPSASGGAEIIKVDIDQENARTSGPESSSPQTDVRSNGSQSGDSIPKGYGRIIRDEGGNILRIELAEEKDSSPVGNEDVDMEQLEPELDEVVKEKWIEDLGAHGKRVLLKDSDRKDIMGELEKLSTLRTSGKGISASLSGAGPRHASKGEKEYLGRLVAKYGLSEDGVEKMARDRKLNTEQRTEGELRRGLRRGGWNGV